MLPYGFTGTHVCAGSGASGGSGDSGGCPGTTNVKLLTVSSYSNSVFTIALADFQNSTQAAPLELDRTETHIVFDACGATSGCCGRACA